MLSNSCGLRDRWKFENVEWLQREQLSNWLHIITGGLNRVEETLSEEKEKKKEKKNVSEARSTSVMLTVRLTDDGEGKMGTWDCTFDQFILSFLHSFFLSKWALRVRLIFSLSPSPSLLWLWQLMGQINHAPLGIVSQQLVFVSERDGEKENKYTWLYWLQMWRTQIKLYRYCLPKNENNPMIFSHNKKQMT